MAALGLFLIWSGYTFGVYGFSKIKSAYGASPSLALADVALPSHRATYITAATGWTSGTSNSTAASTGAASTTGTPASSATSKTLSTGGASGAAAGLSAIPSPTPATWGTFVP